MVSPALPSQTPRPLMLAAFILVAWVAFAFAFTPLRASHDEFWHLKTGKYIAAHGLPGREIFTTTAAEFPWHNHEWLTQWAMWQTWRLGEASGVGGIRAVIAFKTLFIVLAFAGFGLLLARDLRWRGLDPLWAAIAAALCAALARRTFYPRPPFVTYLLLGLVLWIFIEVRAGRWRERWLWLLPFIFAVWANLHGGWMAGLLVVGAYWGEAAAMLLITCLLHTDVRGAGRRLGRLTLLGLACGVGTLVNPYGARLYELAGTVFKDRYLLESIGEMLPPDWRFVWILEGVILLYAAAALRPVRLRPWIATGCVLVALHFALRHVPGPWWQVALALPFVAVALARTQAPGVLAHVLLTGFFMQQGVLHVRHLSLLAVVALPGLAWALAGWAEAQADHATPRYGALANESATTENSNDNSATTFSLDLSGLAWVAGLLTLVALSGWWLFSRREGPSYFERNVQLAGGQELAVSLVDWRAPSLPVAGTLPRGVFLAEAYPVRTVDFLLRAQLPAPIFNGGNYAGYLIWRLAPEHFRVFTDNRYDIYGGVVIRDEHSVLNGWSHSDIAELKRRGVPLGDFDRAWNDVLDHWKIQTVFIPADAPGNARLAAGGWQRVYEDFAFNLWVRDTPANQAVIERARSLERPAPWSAVIAPPEG